MCQLNMSQQSAALYMQCDIIGKDKAYGKRGVRQAKVFFKSTIIYFINLYLNHIFILYWTDSQWTNRLSNSFYNIQFNLTNKHK